MSKAGEHGQADTQRLEMGTHDAKPMKAKTRKKERAYENEEYRIHNDPPPVESVP
jgi:hypothetical protein